jgi:hypothetical protein
VSKRKERKEAKVNRQTERYQRKTRKSLSMEKNYADTSVADPDPGSDAFLIFTPGSGSGIRDGYKSGWMKISYQRA